jgi:hypothetical protein
LKTRRYFFLSIAVIHLIFLLRPWEWGMMDDVGFVVRLQEHITQSGWLDGIFDHLSALYDADKGWGLFRPGYWVYVSLIYQVPPNLAYVIRLAMLTATLMLPLGALARLVMKESDKGKGLLILSAALLCSNRALYDGLSFLSLQEFSGNFFVALGVWICLSARGRPVQLALAGAGFLVAAFFKAPFVWVGISYALVLAIRLGRTRLAVAYGLVALLSLGTLTYWAFNGYYTRGIGHFRWVNLTVGLLQFLKQAAAPSLILALSFVSIRTRLPGFAQLGKREFWDRDSAWMGAALLGGGSLYLATLLHWGGSSGYFYGPPIYLLSLGTIFLLLPALRLGAVKGGRVFPMIALALGALVWSHGFYRLFARDQAIRMARDWALTLPSEGVTIVTNGYESAVRLKELMRVRYPGWNNAIVFVHPRDPFPEIAKYYIEFEDQGGHHPDAPSRMLMRVPMASIFGRGSQ